MNKNPPQIVFEMNHLKNAEEALRELHDSQIYKQYRYELENVKTLEQRYSLAHRYSETLSVKFELEHAIRESRTEIESIKEMEKEEA